MCMLKENYIFALFRILNTIGHAIWLSNIIKICGSYTWYYSMMSVVCVYQFPCWKNSIWACFINLQDLCALLFPIQIMYSLWLKIYVNFYRLNFETLFDFYELLHPFEYNELSIKEIGLVLNVLWVFHSSS